MMATLQEQIAAEDARRAAQKQNAPATAGGTGILSDINEAGHWGLMKGVAGLGGLGGDVPNLAMSAAGKIARWLGASPETQAEIERYRQAVRENNPLPTSEGILKAVEPVTGPAYESKTRMGRIAETATSLLPAAGQTSLIRGLIAPVVGTELGGEAGKMIGGDEGEAWGRLLGGLGGTMAPGAASRLVAGPQVNPVRAQQIRTLADEGVELTGGQASGRKALQYTEAGPFEGKAAALA